MIKACLFDLDGTLLDTLRSLRYHINKNIEDYGIREISEAETKLFVGAGAKNLISRVLGSRGYDINTVETQKLRDRILEKFLKEYDQDPLYLTEPYSGISDAVFELGELGLKLAVISNKPDVTTKALVRKFFPDQFVIVEGASDRFALKPSCEWPLDICKRLEVLPNEVMYVGDTSTDMQTAKNFGAELTVGVLWGFRNKEELDENGADVTVADPLELPMLVKNINKIQEA